MKNKIIKILIIAIVTILFTNCMPQNHRKDISTPTEKKRQNSIERKKVKSRTIQTSLKISGVLEGINDINLVSEVSGKIVSVRKKLGDYVEKGEQIAAINNQDLKLKVDQAKANLDAQEANLESQKIQMKTNKQLFESETISQTEFILSKSRLKSAKAAYDGAAANYKMALRNYEQSRFVAPVSGKIVAMNIEIGDFVSQGTVIGGIVNANKMKLEIGVGEKQIGQLKKGNKVALRIKSNNVKLIGKISGIGVKPSKDKFNYPVEIIIDDPKNAYVGQLVKGEIKSEISSDMVTIPDKYIQTSYDREFVYILNANNKVEKREIELGRKISDLNEVKTGLEVGEYVLYWKNGQLEEGQTINTWKISASDIDSEKGEV